jgi:hypothetical protein
MHTLLCIFAVFCPRWGKSHESLVNFPHERTFHSPDPQSHGNRCRRPDRAARVRRDLSGWKLVAGRLTHGGQQRAHIFDLNKQLSIEMLEARRNEKNFQQRRNEILRQDHAELVVAIDRDFDRLEGADHVREFRALCGQGQGRA